MSFCHSCGSNPCCCTSNLKQQFSTVVQHHIVHPNPCPTVPTTCLPIEFKDSGPGRPLTHGLFQVRDNCGVPVPFSWVTVTFTGTSTKVALFSHPSGPVTLNSQFSIPNPVQTDAFGRAQIYFSGGPIDVVAVFDCNGPNGDVIDQFTNFGGFVDGDFGLQERPTIECLDIPTPLFAVYDGDKCNIPHAMTTADVISIQGNLIAGNPGGKYSNVKAYFECLGIPWPCGVSVYGDTQANKSIYVFDCNNCDVEPPPDPESVTFDENGNSLCWCTRPDTHNHLIGIVEATTINSAVPNAAYIQLPFETVVRDDGYSIVGNEFIIPSDGEYRIGAALGANVGAVDERMHEFRVAITKNGLFTVGNLFHLYIREVGDTVDLFEIIDPFYSGSRIVTLVEGDTIQIQGFFHYITNSPDFPYTDGFSPARAWIEKV